MLSITNLDGTDAGITEAFSCYVNHFLYHPGDIVEAPNFDECRWQECAPGIHFFMDREDAVRY